MRNSLGSWIFALCVVAASGILYGALFYGRASAIGAIFALFVCVPIIAFERGVLFPRLYAWISARSTPVYILLTFIAYYALISIGYTVCGTLLWWLNVLPEATWSNATMLPDNVVFYALGVSAILSFVSRIRELLGRGIFFNLLLGRYRKPIEEERVFLFIDLVDSTAFAAEFGDLRAQQFLSALFATFAEPVRRRKGTIDDYVGDAAIITWPMRRGLRKGRCIHCVFDILDAIEADSDKWLKQFGRVPQLRAALHGGPVITAEIGVDHHKITYFGDTVNTAARLETLCRTLEAPVLISSELASRMKLSSDIDAEYLGTHAVRGRGQSLGVIALQREQKRLSKGVVQRA
ncbi:adenylate/guanylate cyclase domain-containing protein [Phyllobacterium zundukense]|uniref:Adenylate cyclase n=1 Tax=Phyllobacterium zundukense TaxID=1867719 RepID=A0A2N9VY56_9HYPH|nr:adenylate/guanylate cyclase domain-containing protein [Phyllobacterium zundukense]ATU94715.1 adenylate cyclase [Phyllobacterium zundukense]PIO44424.1 adenylate cyclase [Phyllobacterium zundukense]